MAEPLTCWRRECALGDPPTPIPGRPGTMLGPEEVQSEVGTVRGGFGGKGRVIGSFRPDASGSGRLPADPGKEPARGCALAAGWARGPTPT